MTIVGRLKYLQVQLPYLLAYRAGPQHHHYWCMNVYDKETEAWIQHVTAEYPDFFSIMRIPEGQKVHEWPGFNVQYFLNGISLNGSNGSDGSDGSDVVYVKLDDDVVYLSPNFFETLYQEKIAHPEIPVLCPFIINNQAHAHVAQKHGLLPSYWEYIHDATWCYTGENTHKLNYFHNLEFGVALHRLFLADTSSRWINWRDNIWTFSKSSRFSINCVAMTEKDLVKIRPVPCDDEEYLSRTVPQTLGRNNAMTTKCMCVHFSFYNQQGHFLEHGLLEDYVKLCNNIHKLNT